MFPLGLFTTAVVLAGFHWYKGKVQIWENILLTKSRADRTAWSVNMLKIQKWRYIHVESLLHWDANLLLVWSPQCGVNTSEEAGG